MSVTKNLAELCTLLVDEAHGEIASRVFANLLNRGRCTLLHLAQHTALTPNQIRNGITTLLQCNLLFYHRQQSPKTTWYEANPFAAYDLIRRPKVLSLIEALYGSAAREVIEALQSLGHAKVHELEGIFRNKIESWKQQQNGDPDDYQESDEQPALQSQVEPEVRSVEHLRSILDTLIRGDVLEAVSSRSFQAQADRIQEVESEIGQKHFPTGVKGTKGKEEWQQLVSSRLRELRDLPKRLKRSMETNGHGRSKLRKLTNGDIANGAHDDDGYHFLSPNTTLRINDEKCTVFLRNQELVRVVSETMGETTGQVYNVVLRLMTESLPRCRLDPMIDGNSSGGDSDLANNTITTTAIFEQLDTAIDVFVGIGKAAEGKIDFYSAERLQKRPPGKRMGHDEAEVDGNASGDEEFEEMDEDDDYDSEAEHIKHKPASASNGIKESRVTFDDSIPSRESRLYQMRQHLLLLCESKHGFLRHCDRGEWTVDFPSLVRSLQEMELDNIMEKKVGRHGLRLARILREKGKLDERTLPGLALMKKAEVQNKMLEMQRHGYAEIQEVPRDNTRTANRTTFLWYSNMERSISQQIDNSYKAMLRCLQILDVHRQENKEILAFVDQPEIKGCEQEMLEKKYYDRYLKYCEIEKRLLGQAAKLDSLVALLRDF